MSTLIRRLVSPAALAASQSSQDAALADTTVSTNGAARVGAKYSAGSAVPLNLKEYLEDDGSYSVMGFVSNATGVKSAIRNMTSVVDQDAAVQAALTAAYNDNCRGIALPRGLFNIGGAGLSVTMTGNRINQGLRISGAGKNASVLKQTGSPTVQLLSVTSSAPTTSNTDAQLVIENLTMSGAGKTKHGLSLYGIANFELRNLVLDSFDRNMNLQSCLIGKVHGCDLSAGNIGLYVRRNGTSAFNNLLEFSGLSRIFSNSTFGIDIGSASMLLADKLDIEANGAAGNTSTGGIIVRNTCDDEIGLALVHLSGLWLENNLGRGIQVEAMSELTLSLHKSQIIAQESGRSLLIAGARKVSIEDSYSPSTGDTWDITCDQLFAKNVTVNVLTDSGVAYPTYVNVTTAGAEYISGKEGSSVLTLQGCTTSPTGNATWKVQGKKVTIVIPAVSGVSNATTAKLVGLPASLAPSVARAFVTKCTDNGVEKVSEATVETNGDIKLNNGFVGTFTTSGTKGHSLGGLVVTYER